mgnify:CR=1 FL=1
MDNDLQIKLNHKLDDLVAKKIMSLLENSLRENIKKDESGYTLKFTFDYYITTGELMEEILSEFLNPPIIAGDISKI